MSYPDGPTDCAKIDSTKYDSKLIGKNDLGCVYVHGPFGNVTSDVKIAYLIGMHPLESKSHRALFENLTNNDELKYCYYIYNICVKELNSETEGRMEGQLLAKEFVVPCIVDGQYDLFMDIHSNRGSHGPGDYQITNFIFAPGFDEKSTEYMNILLDDIEGVEYYAPEHRTSPPFITEPTSKAGIPTLVYECYSYEPMNVSCDLASKLINSIEKLIFK
ncbi:MAG: adhesin [Methanobrevibacter sp.]|uniref:adhesin n=1 Tax=uncultured Methanobrevibacter sp. TaxID=253161 RepID=UPI0025E82847|nr:adhesin [uncultured Methanobrevibacter sp.]MEE1129462.1 adhesin [Methanobrevibacter sp.]